MWCSTTVVVNLSGSVPLILVRQQEDVLPSPLCTETFDCKFPQRVLRFRNSRKPISCSTFKPNQWESVKNIQWFCERLNFKRIVDRKKLTFFYTWSLCGYKGFFTYVLRSQEFYWVLQNVTSICLLFIPLGIGYQMYGLLSLISS